MKFFLVLNFAMFTLALPLLGQGSKKPSTNAAPPKFTDKYIEGINLATEVPNPVEQFKYVVHGEIDGVVYYTDKIPLITFENSEKWKARVGEIAVGTELKLDKITGHGGRIYYGVDMKVKIGAKEVTKVGWLDGMFVKIAGTQAASK